MDHFNHCKTTVKLQQPEIQWYGTPDSPASELASVSEQALAASAEPNDTKYRFHQIISSFAAWQINKIRLKF
jgi:hypothetical protein